MSGPAQLYRSTAKCREEVEYGSSELIGDGDMAKMVRLALTDPQDELWRYSIQYAGNTLYGEQIRSVAIGSPLDRPIEN